MTVNVDILKPIQWTAGQVFGALIAPMKDTIFYLVPNFAATVNGHNLIQKNGSSPVNRILLPEAIESLTREVKTLMKCARQSGDPQLYTHLNIPYDGSGSCFGKTLTLPLEDITNINFTTDIKEEPNLTNSELESRKNITTPNEVRFKIARAINNMNYTTLRVAARIAILLLTIALFFTPIGWIGGLGVLILASLLYCSVNRYIEQRADRRTIKILTKRFEQSGFSHLEASIQAHATAISCLKKAQQINLHQRKGNLYCRFLITSKGSARLDFSTPPLVSRIKSLEKSLFSLTQTLETQEKEEAEKIQYMFQLLCASATFI